MSDSALSLLVARVFCTEAGGELRNWMHAEHSALTLGWVEDRIAEARKLWSTGGSVTERP